MDIIVLGTRKYNWLLEPFAHLLNRYWGASCTHWGDEPTPWLPFRHVPAFDGPWEWDHWFGAGLRSVLAELESDVFCLLLPDHWIAAPVDRRGVAAMAQYMGRDPTILRGNLTAGTCLAVYGGLERTWWGRRIVAVPPTDPHCGTYGGFTFSPALWNRKLFMENVEAHWTIWECEKLGTDQRVARKWPEVRSVGVEPGPVRRTHGLHHGQPNLANLDGLSPEDAEAVRSMVPLEWGTR